MNKKEKSEANIRDKKAKRIKTHHARPNVLSIIPVNIDCFRLEEQEPNEDCHLRFVDICEKIRNTFHTMFIIKREGENQTFLIQNKPRICMWIISLKKLNRLDKHKWKKSKDAVNDRKQNIDASNFQYQNLLYEANHLQKEVTKCLEFRSKDEDIKLVSVEEFRRDAPPHISKREITDNDPHELRMARLMWESEQRKIKAAKLKESDLIKEKLNQEIKKLKENLANIQPILKSITEAAQPFKNKMGMAFYAKPKMHLSAKFLPKPLYVLYVQANAYVEYSGKKIEIRIEGNIDDAKALQLKSVELSDDSGESDQEDSTEVTLHRHLSRSKSNTSKDIMMKHPMSVFITIDVEGSSVCLQFIYMPHLHIVTVKTVSLSPEPMSDELTGNLLRLDTFLNCLFPKDTGRETPNLSNVYILRKKYGTEECPFSNETTGWPYQWAQEISGLSFLPFSREIEKESRRLYKEIPFKMEKTIKTIYSRLASRQKLYHQIISLEQRIIVPPNFAALYPSNISTQIKSWSPTSWNEVKNTINVDELKDLNIISKDCLIYRVQLVRGSAFLSINIFIPPNYPQKTPVFILQLFWKGTHSSTSNFALRELEEEVNVRFIETLSEEFKSSLLVCQLYHLTVCFDVFLENENSGDSFEGPHEFVREKVVVKHVRGRSHSCPYKCLPSQGIFTFR